jgi:hypothetical protein
VLVEGYQVKKSRVLSSTPGSVKPVPEALENVTTQGRPKQRVANTAVARTVYDDFKTSLEPRARNWARIKAVVGGNRPFDQNELTRLGQGWRANFNTREARAMVNQIVSASWELHFEVPTFIEVELTPAVRASLRLEPETEDHICQVVAEEYTKTLQDWPGFYSNVHLATHSAVSVGMGFMTWLDPWDWRPKAYHPGYVKLKPWATVNIDEQDIVCVDMEFEFADLFSYAFLTEEVAAGIGWNQKALREYLVAVFHEGATSGSATDQQPSSTWESLQQAYQMNQPNVVGRQYQKVQFISLFVKEYDPENERWGVSQLIIPREDKYAGASGFLFEKRSMYPSFRQALWFLFYEYGDGYIESVKGFGHDVFAYAEYSNRFVCQALDGGMLAASVVLQMKQGLSAASNSAVRSGPFTFLSSDVQLSTTQFNPQIGGLMQLRSALQDVLHNNTGIYKPKAEFQRDSEAPKTARQVVSEESREARFEKNKAVLYYVQWKMFHQEVFRRLTEPAYLLAPVEMPGQAEARSFFGRCVARGVPHNVLLSNQAFEIHVSQAVGLGSPGAKMDITNQLMAARPAMAESGRRYTERLWASARGLSWRQVDRIFPAMRRDQTPTAATGIATLENNDFSEGKTVPVSSEDVHIAHLPVHLSQLMQIAQAYKESPQAMDVQSSLATFEASLPHVDQHIQMLAQDETRREQVDTFTQIFQGAVKVYKALQASAEKILKSQQGLEQQRAAMMQQAVQQLASRDNEVELFKAQQKAQIESEKQKSINETRAFREQTQQALKAQHQQFEQSLKAQQAAFDESLRVRQQAFDEALAQLKRPARGGK